MECEVRNVATVWDGEVAGMAGSLARVGPNRKQRILILTDSKAAIVAVRRAGRTGKAGSTQLKKVVNTVADIEEGGGRSNWGR